MESKNILRVWSAIFICMAVLCTGLSAEDGRRGDPNRRGDETADVNDTNDIRDPNESRTGDVNDSNECVYKDCIVQEISIIQLRGAFSVRKYFYKHVRTNLVPIDSNGVINEEKSVDWDPGDPNEALPGVRELIEEAEAVLGKSLAEMLNATQDGRGVSTHSFGCADECPCVKKNETVTLPNGNVVPLPDQVVSSGYPPHRDAEPGNDCPLAVIEKRVTIPGKGTYLLTYHIRLYGTVRRCRGECTK